MEELIQHPAVVAGLLPLLVAAGVGALLARTRHAWLAASAGYLAMVALTTGVSFSPLSASRKVLLIALLAPFAGAVLDRWTGGSRVARVAAAAVGAGACGAWAFATVLGQRETADALLAGAGVVAIVALLVIALYRLEDDGPAAAGAGVGLGLAVGVSALLSASTGYFMAGIAFAAACGGLQLLQLATARALVPGATGAMGVGVAAALFAAATALLAQLSWIAVAAMLLPAVLPGLPVLRDASVRTRVVVLSLLALAGASVPIALAWFAATGASA